MVNGKKNLAEMIGRGVALAHGRKILRREEYKTPNAPAVIVTLAQPDWEKFRRERAAALPEIMAALVAEYALLRGDAMAAQDKKAQAEAGIKILSGLEADAGEMAYRAAAATYVLEIRDPAASPEGEPPVITLGWVASLSVPLADYDESMAAETVPFTPDLVPLFLRHSPSFNLWVTSRLNEARKFYDRAREAEEENLKRPQDGTDPASLPAANASTTSSGLPGDATPSSVPSPDETTPGGPSANA